MNAERIQFFENIREEAEKRLQERYDRKCGPWFQLWIKFGFTRIYMRASGSKVKCWIEQLRSGKFIIRYKERPDVDDILCSKSSLQKLKIMLDIKSDFFCEFYDALKSLSGGYIRYKEPKNANTL